MCLPIVQFEGIMHLSARYARHQRQSALIDEQMVFASDLAAVGGIGAGMLSAEGAWHAGRVDTGAFPLNLIELPQVVQHGLVDALPDTCLLPCVQTSPAAHAAATAQFTGQIFPRQACLEDEQNTSQGGAVVNARASTLGGMADVLAAKAGSSPKDHREEVL